MHNELVKNLHPKWRKAQCTLKHALKPLLEEFSLTKVDARIIMVIQRNMALSKAELATHLSFEPASLTRSLDRLVDRGIIERKTDEQDKRFVRLQLTSTGDKLVKQYKQQVRKVWRAAFSGLSDESIENFRSVLETIITNLDN